MKVFISHSSSDKRFVRTLKGDLNENGIATWFDEDELKLGDSLTPKLLRAIDATSHFIVVLSEESVNSQWVNIELQRVLFNRKLGFFKKIVPIKWRECNMPDALKEFLYADLSREQVKVVGNQVEFISEGYNNFIGQLVTSLRDQSCGINDLDRLEMKHLLLPDNGKTTGIVRSFGNGTFYRNETPDAPFIINEGDKVKVGQDIYILESPEKIYNRVESEYTGIVLKVFPANGADVEYDEPVMLIDTTNYDSVNLNSYPRIQAGRFKLVSLQENKNEKYSIVSTVDGTIHFNLIPYSVPFIKENQYINGGQELFRIQTASENFILTSPLGGHISTIKVTNGQEVKKGNILLILEDKAS